VAARRRDRVAWCEDVAVASRWADGYAQARHDLEQARASAAARRYDWACFAAHQAAEKAVTGLHLRHGQATRGHVVARLLADLPETVRPKPELIDAGRVLDTFYIPTRYPDSHADGPPFEDYGRLHGEEALRHAGDVLAFVAEALADG
jgi:HEPN domain-containing protein